MNQNYNTTIFLTSHDISDIEKLCKRIIIINHGKIVFDNCKYVSEESYKKMIKSTFPEKGDVLYTKVGATYGIPAYVDTDRKFWKTS